jgi:hypothetical protein
VISGGLHRAMRCRFCERGGGREYAPDASGPDVLGGCSVERLRDATTATDIAATATH